MTLATTTSRVNYNGSGSVGPFTIPFRFLTTADLLVTKRTAAGAESILTLTTDYSVTGAGDATGALTLVTALATGEILTIRRRPSNTQNTSLRNQASYYGASHEDALDRLAMLVQSLRDETDRRIGLKETYDPALYSLLLKPEVGKVLAWQSATELGNSTLDSSAVALPGEGRTVATLSAYLLNNRVYNVRDYGALGDGVTNDKAAFKAAVAACPVGGTVWVPRASGDYYIDIEAGAADAESRAIAINKRLTVVIEGTIRSSVGAIQANPPTIFLVSGSGVTFMGPGTVKGSGAVDATNSGTAATLPSLVKVTGDNFTWTGLTLETPWKIGIHLSGCFHARITNAAFVGGPTAYGSPGTTSYFAIRGEQGGRHVIANNVFVPNSSGGTWVSGIFLNNTNWCVIDANICYRPYEKLVYGACSYTVISNNVVIGRDPAAGVIPGTNQTGTLGPVFRADGVFNKIIGNFSQYGGGAQALVGGGGTDISNNTFLDCGQGGISVTEAGATQAAHYISICNNVITCGNLSGVNVGDGILVRTPNSFGPHRYIRIQGNTVNGFALADPTVNIPARAASTTYNVDTHIVKPSAGPNGFYYVPIVSGVSGSGGDPVWPLVAGNTVVDGSVTWQCVDPETAVRAQIRLKALGAGQEISRAIIADNNLAGGLRGLSLERLDHSEIFGNRIQATTWGIVETTGSNNRYRDNPIESASNAGVQTLGSSCVVDDYRQGTWTPVLADGAGNTAAMAASSSNQGKWVRHGRMVIVVANVATTSLTGVGTVSGAVRVNGLPFAPGAAAGDNGSAVFGYAGGMAIPVAGQSVTIATVNGQTYARLHLWDALAGVTDLQASEWSATGNGNFCLIYFTDAPFPSL